MDYLEEGSESRKQGGLSRYIDPIHQAKTRDGSDLTFKSIAKDNFVMSQKNNDLNVHESGEMSLIDDQHSLPELSAMQIRVIK